MGLPPCEAGWQPHPHNKSSLVSTWGTPLILHLNKRKERERERRSGKRGEEKKTEENDVFFQPADRHE